VALAERLFGHAAWAARAHALTGALDDAAAHLATAGDDLAAPFSLGAAALAHVRADPLLPDALVGEAAAGPALRAAYGRYQEAFGAAVRRLLRR
jgi:phenylacetic acid degradation operon negative regulatory protein